MPAPSKEIVQQFILENESFFKTPLSKEGQEKFKRFYLDVNAMHEITDYSFQLENILRQTQYAFDENNTTLTQGVIYPWHEGDFAPALEHETIRQFIMDNKDHPAILIWRSKNTKQESASATPQPSTPLKESEQSLLRLKEIEQNLLKLDMERFDHLFAESDTHIMQATILVGRRLANELRTKEKFSFDVFKTQQDYDAWRTKMVTFKKKQTLNKAPEEVTQKKDQKNPVQKRIEKTIKAKKVIKEEVTQTKDHENPVPKRTETKVKENSEEAEKESKKYADYVDQLLKVTQAYKDELSDENTPTHEIVGQLIKKLNEGKTKATIEGFYAILNHKEEGKASNLQVIEKNDERSTKRFIQGLAIITFTLVTGVLPGLLLMTAVFALTNKTPLSFFKPLGKEFQETLAKLRVDNKPENDSSSKI